MKTLVVYLLLISLTWNLFGCGANNSHQVASENNWKTNPINSSLEKLEQTISKSGGKLSESAPPQVIQELNQNLAQFYPEVAILSPTSEEIFNDPNIPVKLQVKNFSIFKNKQLAIGPHLNLIVDNQLAQPIYNLDEPIILKDLDPGSHSLRVFAVRPWGESFKNQQAYAQTTFHILTKTDRNRPNANLPLLTYNLPTGEYGAEPILFDFYLSNAPLHVAAQENPDDEIKDWRIRVTVNGESFLIDRWEPFYLQGFKRGNNWVQLELVDEQGNNIDNAFNNTVRLVSYDPNKQDTLTKLFKDKIPVDEAVAIVDSKYQTKPNQHQVDNTIKPEINKTEKQQAKNKLNLPPSATLNNQQIETTKKELETKVDLQSPPSETLNNQQIETTEKELETKVDLQSPPSETLNNQQIETTEKELETKVDLQSPPSETLPIENK